MKECRNTCATLWRSEGRQPGMLVLDSTLFASWSLVCYRVQQASSYLPVNVLWEHWDMGSGDWNSPPLRGASILPREQAISLALVSSLLRWGLGDYRSDVLV